MMFSKLKKKLNPSVHVTMKLLLAIGILISSLTMIETPVQAAAPGGGVVTSEIDRSYTCAMETGGWKKLYVNGSHVYCVQNHQLWKDGQNYKVTGRPSWISEDEVTKMTLWDYYATQVFDGSKEYLMAVQSLVWGLFENYNDLAIFNQQEYLLSHPSQWTFSNGGNGVAQKMETLKYWANKHGTLPNLTGSGVMGYTLTLKPGQSVTLTDTHGVLEVFKKVSKTDDGIQVSMNGNKVTITASDNAKSTSSVTFSQPSAKPGPTTFYRQSRERNQDYWYQQTMYTGGNPVYQHTLNIQVDIDGVLDVLKVSSQPNYTNQNNGYSLAGATYGLFNNAQCSGDPLHTFVMRSDGTTDALQICKGKYWLKELKAPQGYQLDRNIYPVTVSSGETTKIEVSDQPLLDPVRIMLKKKDASTGQPTPTNKGELANAHYSFKFYAGTYDENIDPSTLGIHPTRAWVFKTDENGEIYLKDAYKVSGDELYYNELGASLPIGTIVIQEVKAPNGYILSQEKFIRRIKLDPTLANFIDYNIPEVAEKAISFKVIKKLEGTDLPIENVLFEHTSADGTVEQVTTNKQGEVTLSRLDQGTHTIKEVSVPDGYLINPNVFTFSIDEQGNTTSSDDLNGKAMTFTQAVIGEGVLTVFDDEPTGTIHLSKAIDYQDLENWMNGESTIEGAEYTLYAAEDISNFKGTISYSKDQAVKTVRTDGQGQMPSIEGLLLGKYYLLETKAPVGLVLDTTKYPISIDYEGHDVSVIVRESHLEDRIKRQAFEIIKISSDGQLGSQPPLQGAEFTVKLKRDVETLGWDNAPTYDVLVTDKNGHAKSMELPYGTYIVKETVVPADHYPVRDFEVVISEDSREPQPYRVLNDAPFKAYIRIVKKDAETGNTVLLKNTSFKIKNVDTGEYLTQKVGNKKVDTFKTDDDGIAQTPLMVMYGKYQLEEVTAPDGYVLNSEKIDFTITNAGAVNVDEDGNPIVTFDFSNTPVKGKITIKKEGDVLVGYENGQFVYEPQGLMGAIFHIIAQEDIYSADHQGTLLYSKGQVVEEIRTGILGYAYSSDLPLGRYIVKEIQAPYGYLLDETEYKVDLTYKDQHTSIIQSQLQVANQRQKIELNVKKMDSVTEQKPQGFATLEGAEFTLFANKEIVAVTDEILFNKGDVIEVATSNAKGEIVFKSDLPNGKYLIKETKAPEGYALSDVSIELDGNFKDHKLSVIQLDAIIKNDITQVEVSKKDITTSEELPNAHLQVKDDQGKIVDEWISSDKPHLIQGLVVGKEYTLVETAHPKGFNFANEIKFIVEDTGNIQKVEMLDELVTGEITFSKDGNAFNSVKGTETDFGVMKTPEWTKAKLQNAELTIYAAEDITLGNNKIYFKKDEVVETVTTDENGVVESKPLLVGKYYAVETKAPEGYVIDPTPYEFEVKDNGSLELQLFEHNIFNNRTKVIFDMTKVMEESIFDEKSQAYKDVVFGIFADGDILEANGEALIHKDELVSIHKVDHNGRLFNVQELPYGSYYLKELSTSEDYILLEDKLPFTIEYQGQHVSEYTIHIGDVTNDLKRTSIQIRKVDSKDKTKVLKNAEFTLFDKNDNKLSTIHTNEKGIATFENIEYGEYYLKETLAPKGYRLSKDKISVVVDDTYDKEHMYEVEVTNDLLPVVQTGDDTSMSLYGVMFVSSTLALAVFLTYVRIKKAMH